MSKANGKILWEKLDEYEQELLVDSGAKIKYLFGSDNVCICMYGDYKFNVPFFVFEYMIKFDKENGREKIYRSNDVTDFYLVKKNVDVKEEYRELQFKIPEDVYEDVLCAVLLPTNATAAELFKSLNDYISGKVN